MTTTRPAELAIVITEPGAGGCRPSSMALFGAGVIGFVVTRRKRQQD